MQFVAPILAAAAPILNSIMGGRHSSPPPQVDVGAIMRANQETVNKIMAESRKQIDDLRSEMQKASAAEKKALEERLTEKEEGFKAKLEEVKRLAKEQEDVLKASIDNANKKADELSEQLMKPVKDREAKMKFVDDLKLEIKQTDSIALIGPKGMGKSTFLWLAGKGPKPAKSLTDGTTIIIKNIPGYIDTIGIMGWDLMNLLKLLVIFIYEGMPRDIIIFNNDRIERPLTGLGLVGVINPMIVMMNSTFWKEHNKNRINLLKNGKGVHLVTPAEDLDKVYDLETYNQIKELNMGTPITHHDDVRAVSNKRQQNGIRPFNYIIQTLGAHFQYTGEKTTFMESIFRLIYIFEKRYNKDILKFMNEANITEFDLL